MNIISCDSNKAAPRDNEQYYHTCRLHFVTHAPYPTYYTRVKKNTIGTNINWFKINKQQSQHFIIYLL